jgi:CheY-like chemotaxis protein
MGHLVIHVEDGGGHFDVEAVIRRLERPEGFGLFKVQQRLEALGGRLELNVSAGGGACLRLVIPLDETGVTRPTPRELTRAEMSHRPLKKSGPLGMPLRVIVADDHVVVREGFVALLNCQPDFEVISEASDGHEAIQQADALVPDVVVMDVEMPNLNGIEATRHIKRQQPDVVVVGLSLHQEEGMARAMIEAGADAYVSKNVPAQEFVAALRQACLPDGSDRELPSRPRHRSSG